MGRRDGRHAGMIRHLRDHIQISVAKGVIETFDAATLRSNQLLDHSLSAGATFFEQAFGAFR